MGTGVPFCSGSGQGSAEACLFFRNSICVRNQEQFATQFDMKKLQGPSVSKQRGSFIHNNIQL